MSALRDDWDEQLRRNVHPPDWTNPEPAGLYDLVAIGGGTAGLISAAGAAGVGARAALIERRHLGGDCLNVGCVPSKSLLRSAHLAAELRDAERFGVRAAGEPEVDFRTVMERMRRIRAQISPVDSARRYRDELGVDVFLGEARFTGPREIEVGGRRLRFKKAVIATGARPWLPPVAGLADAGFLTNETVFDLTELPPRLLVLGGGPIGCELAQAFRRFGARVTLVEMGEQLLPREDPDAAAVVRASFERDGVDLRLGTAAIRVERRDSETRVALESAGSRDEVAVDAVLVAAGRQANVEEMGLEDAGVDFDPRQGVQVDDQLRTANPRVFAAGDVCLRTQFTHAAEYSARIVIQNALFFRRLKVSGLTIPWCTYTSPELAHVGLSERDAREQGVEIDTWHRGFDEVDRAIAEGETHGFVKVHTARGKDRILGATIVARHAGDLISEVSVAMAGGLGLGGLANVIHPYPTEADALRQLGSAYMRTRLTPTVARILRFLLRIQS